MNSGRRTARQEEELHVQRRNAELRKQEHWNSVAEYFKTWDVKASKYASWTSEDYFKQSEEARVEAENKEKKKQTLDERREKLRLVLESEQKLFEDEIKTKRHGGASWMPLDELKGVNLELKLRSEQARRREAELIQYQRWKQEQPTLRDLERRQHLEFMKKSWIDQVKEREVLREKQKAEAALRAKEEELKQKEAEEFDRLHLKRKEEELKDLKSQIKRQLEEIKASAEKCKEIERQEAEERRLQAEIEEMIIQRKLADQKQAHKQLAAFWTRQYQLKLQKKNKEIEEEIIQDQKMLERLEEGLKREVKVKAHAREFAKKEMELALKELQMHRQRELLRQKEYEHMYFEEAKRAWEIQEKKWMQERQARDRLMTEVLDTVKKQIEEKIERNIAQRAETLADREQMMIGINRLYDECSLRETEMKLAQEHYRKDLDDQIAQKTIEKVKKMQEETEFEQKQSLNKKEEEQKLAAELEKLQIGFEKYKPPDFRRRRVVW
ncbi:trichoplein keratin filament-binding protein-like [Macrosteles quadrilineatus]|uniref:trichoplein keratin filament-binding protein-like n=1 Tax=Macrosteles quadrilineatus TaxID=74068 RepID=UPI0023E2C017|nr:trichoplein keratin filament-binding protein-like [Macrosteles quadrilineatus]